MATARLQWTLSADDGAGSADVSGYDVARGNAPNATTVIAPDLAAGVAQYDDTVGNGTFYWRVRAKDTTGNLSAWSNEVSQSVDELAPAAPTGLAVTIL